MQCCLTGVKSFKYEQKYDLRAYIDDGGMISEILIDHDVSSCWGFIDDNIQLEFVRLIDCLRPFRLYRKG